MSEDEWRQRQRRSRINRQVSQHPLLLEDVLHLVFKFLDNPADRRSISEVCRLWCEIDRETRKHVYVAFTYSVAPAALTRRFRSITSLKLKGKPRAYEFNLLPKNWGGHVAPWITAIVPAYRDLSALHLRRMEVSDADLQDLADGFASTLQSLKLDFCTGFSTKGLRAITRACRRLRVLYLENSDVEDEGGEWLHELALHNRQLEVLDFQLANGIVNVSAEDIRLIIQNCPTLTSLKLVEEAAGDALRQVLSRASSLKELGVFFSADDEDNEERYELPKNLTSISGDIPPTLLSPIASQLVKLDLMTSTSMSAEQHHALLRRCTRLQNLQVRNILGDEGLTVVGECCKDLRKIRIEELDDVGAFVSHLGLTALAQGCNMLQKLAIYVCDISNHALMAVGRSCPNLVDFRFILTETKPVELMTELPLDDGFVGIMRGCKHLARLCIYVRPGAVSDQGMLRIGDYSGNLKALLLGCVGDSDEGFLGMATGLGNLERLEMRDCFFTEDALARGYGCMPKLKLLWVQGFRIDDHRKLGKLMETHKDTVVEFTSNAPVQCLIYKSLAGPRQDCPEEVISPQGSGAHWLDLAGAVGPGLVAGF